MKLNFTKGIHTNSEPINTPEGYYRDAENMRNHGGGKRSEEGTLLLVGVPSDVTPWGNCSIGNQTILLCQQAGKSVIASLDTSDNWVVEVPARAGIDILGITGPTQMVGKKNWAGERVIYFSTPSGSRRINLDKPLPTDDTAFDKVTSLFLEYNLPKVKYIGESSSGQLKSGVYQIAARLVTDSGAKTSFGIVSSVIPVISANLQSTSGSIQGDPPQTQTNKAIEVLIENVDPTFKYIELGVLTYEGMGNTPVLAASNLISINGNTSITYTYRGAPDNFGTLSIDEFIISGVAYSTGEFLTQKDGALIVGAPKEAAQPAIDWHRVAAGIVAKFTVKLIPYKEALKFSPLNLKDNKFELHESSTMVVGDGYKNPVTCALYKTYRRKEVYGFTLTPVFTSGVHGPTVHIPADHSVPTEAVNAVNADDGGTLGTYISEHRYPEAAYPGIAAGDFLRLHKFPDAIQQPLISGNVENGNCKLRVLGVKFENIVLDPSEVEFAPQIAGFIIGRLNRVNNETQLAQGIVRPNTAVKYNNNNAFTYGPMIGDGFTMWETNHGVDDDQNTCRPYGPPKLDDFTFVAPDLIHGLYDADNATHIQQHSVYTADPYAAKTTFDILSHPDREEGYSRTKGFFKNILGASTQVIDTTEVPLDGDKLDIGPFGVPRAPHALGGKENTSFIKGNKIMKMCSSDGFVWMSTLNGVAIKYFRDRYSHYHSHTRVRKNNDHDKMIFELSTTVNAPWNQYTAPPANYRSNFVVHTLTKKNTKQYGPLDQMTSMFTHYQDWKDFSGSVEFFNGDTFISKYGLTLNEEGYWAYPTDDTANDPDKIGYLKPANVSGVVYFWLESSNNYEYRHYITPKSFSAENVDSVGSQPFFPAYKQLLNNEVPFGLLSMSGPNWTMVGHASQYNNQYSSQATFKPYVVTPKEDVERKASLRNRILYSSTAVQGEKSDAYQIFLPNNYYDVPQEYGELTDVYVNRELFASTNQVQWRLFFNTLATQATNVGEIVLGTGGAFARPAVPMVTVDGGYGGTSHWTHALNTVYGRVFVDKLQGRFFLMEEQLQIISGDLHDNDKLAIQKLYDEEIRLGSEPLRERVFIKVGANTMWSYNLEHKAFVSKHTYSPRWMFSHGSYMYAHNNNPTNSFVPGMYKHSVGPTGHFYGKQLAASITLIANMDTSKSKDFKALEILSRSTKEDGMPLPFTTFTELQVWNDERFSGRVKISPKVSGFQLPNIMETLSSKVKDSFRLIMPRDIIWDPRARRWDAANHKQKPGDTVEAQWLAKMQGSFIEIKLITDNLTGPIILFDVHVDASENIR